MSVRRPEHGGSSDAEDVISSICKREATKLIKRSRDALRDALLGGGNVFEDLARHFIPEQHARSHSISIRTISLAAKLLLDDQEYAKVAAANHELGSERGWGKSGFDRNEGSLRKAMDTNGLTEWMPDEQARLEELAETMLRPQGVNYAGQPDYDAIAAMLNHEFHDNGNVRNRNAARQEHWKIRDARARADAGSGNREKRKEIPWNDTEENRALLELADSLRNAIGTVNVRGRGGPRPGTTNWQIVAQQLNQRFHSEALQRGKHVRTPQTCLSTARRLRKKLKDEE